MPYYHFCIVYLHTTVAPFPCDLDPGVTSRLVASVSWPLLALYPRAVSRSTECGSSSWADPNVWRCEHCSAGSVIGGPGVGFGKRVGPSCVCQSPQPVVRRAPTGRRRALFVRLCERPQAMHARSLHIISDDDDDSGAAEQAMLNSCLSLFVHCQHTLPTKPTAATV